MAELIDTVSQPFAGNAANENMALVWPPNALRTCMCSMCTEIQTRAWVVKRCMLT